MNINGSVHERNVFISETLERIKDLDIVSVISSYINVERKGGRYGALCPFHNDTRLGNFDINPRTNNFHCYACGVGGDSIEFVREYLNLEFVETIALMGEEYGLISIDDYEKFFSNNKNKPRKKRKKKKVIKKKETLPLVEIADDFTLDTVYKEFLSILNLSEKHKKHLSEVRKISDERIEKAMYRSLGNENVGKTIELLLENLSNYGYDENVLIGIPGFYKKHGKWRFMTVKGIIIPIKNYKGEIVGLQIRKDFSGEGARYIWFSSSFAYSKEEGYEYPCSPENPIDIVLPKNMRKDLFITEGRFEAEVLASKWNYPTMSVQGVGNWKGIEEEIIKLEYSLGFKFDKIFIAFDSDFNLNYQVFDQLKKMSDSILEHLSRDIMYLHWDGELGKGIGDLIIHNDNIKEDNLIVQYKKETIDKRHEEELDKLLKSKELDGLREANQIALINAFL